MTPVNACVLDFSKAFDIVSYNILLQKLCDDTTLLSELIDLFKYWYGHQLDMVKIAGSLSEPYRLECEVRQGGITCPKLFSLYVNGLIEELNNVMVGCSVDGKYIYDISYANDMVLLSPSIPLENF